MYEKYGDTHRFIGVISKKWSYGNDKWATTLSTFFEYAQGGRFNYTYGGDINGDGSVLNDLIYIPTASDLDQMQAVITSYSIHYTKLYESHVFW